MGDEVLIGKKAIILKLNENKYVLKARALKRIRINEGEIFSSSSFLGDSSSGKFIFEYQLNLTVNLKVVGALNTEVVTALMKFSNFLSSPLFFPLSLSSARLKLVYTMHNNISCYWQFKTQNDILSPWDFLCRMNVTMQGGQTLPGMQGTTNSSHMSGSSQLMPGFPLKNSQPYSPSR